MIQSKRSIMKYTIVILSIALIAGCTPFEKEGIHPAPMPSTKPSDKIAKQINNMSLSEKIGQLLIVGVEGYEIDENAKIMIEEEKIGGIILLERNIENAKQLLSLNNSLKSLNSSNAIPLFISVDEEGGSVSRMPIEFKKLPTNREIGLLNDKKLCFEVGKLIAEEIKAFGYNMNFAPVLDINSNSQNTVIGDRAFGENADIVSDLGVSTMNGIKSGGVVSVIKHFPGHGDTLVDSHVDLPVVNYDIDRLNAMELIPFKKSINEGADAVMVAHILMNKLDSEHPASMSKAVATDLLREEMGFNGLVVTDDMTMGAIIKNYDIGQAAVMAINAGVDIIMVCHGYDNQSKVINALQNAVRTGEVSEDRLNESLKRILKLKQKYNLKDEIIDSINIEQINQRIGEITL
jgi:beta-N-acetylhexosaminidase